MDEPRLPPVRRGRTTVLPRALTSLATQAALDVPGSIRHSSGLGRLAGSSYPGVEVRSLPTSVDAQVRVALSWPCQAATIAALVRESVSHLLTEVTGLPATRVDVHVGAFVPAERARPRSGSSGETETRTSRPVVVPQTIRHPTPPPPRVIRRPTAPAPRTPVSPVAPRGARW